MPKTVCQTATGDLVEVGSDTHATIEVNFLTTRPLEKHGDVLSTFACTCRLEAIVSDQIRHNLINLNLLCWKGWKPTLYEGLLTAEQKGITLYPHLYGDCTWLESVEPEHPSAMLASVSSHVGRSVGRSVSFQSPEKPDFSQHEQEFLHEGHGFSRHEHEFSREPFVHESSNMVGESAVAQLPSRVVELLQSGAVGQSGVAQLPSRVVELLQSSAVGEPCQEQRVCQDRHLCQDAPRTFSASPPATSSGPGPVQQSARCISEALHGMSSESLLGMSVGRSVGRAGGCTGDVGVVSQHVESSIPCETPWPEHPSEASEVLGHHAPGQQVEAGSADSGGIHLRPAIEYDSLGDRVEHGGGKDTTLLPSVSDPERGVVHNAALEPLAVGVPEVLSPVLQGRDIRSYDDRGAQPKPQRLEASRMSPGAHCSGPLYRQPEVGDGLASLSAELHEGTDPRNQGESPSGGVVPLFGPVRGPDPRRRGGSGSDGGVIVGGSYELSGATRGNFDKSRGYMDGAATASEVRARRCVDEATVTTSRGAAEEEGTGQDQWKALAGHIRCSSSVVGHVGKCGASSPVDASECLTSEGKQLRFRRPVGSLEGDGGSPQGCVGESAAKDSTKGLQLRWNQRQRLWRIGEQGRHRLHQSRWWHRLRHHARLRSHLYHHHARLQSRFFRHRVRHQHHCLHRQRPLEFITLGPSLPSESDLEVPEIGLEPLDGTSEYEPSLAPEDEEDLMSDVAPEPPEKPDRLPVRYLEELFGCTRFVRNGLSGCDAYDLEAFCNVLVGRSSVEKLPVELERGVDCVSVPVGRSVAASASGGRSVDSVGWSVGSACSVVTDKDPEKYGAYMPIRDRSVWVSRPRVSYDDVDGIQLDEKESWAGRSRPSTPSRLVFSVRGPRWTITRRNTPDAE